MMPLPFHVVRRSRRRGPLDHEHVDNDDGGRHDAPAGARHDRSDSADDRYHHALADAPDPTTTTPPETETGSDTQSSTGDTDADGSIAGTSGGDTLATGDHRSEDTLTGGWGNDTNGGEDHRGDLGGTTITGTDGADFLMGGHGDD